MKKRMMKLTALSMAALMTASLAACGGGSSEGGEAKGDGGKAESKEIVYWNIATDSPDKDITAAAVEKFNSTTESGYTVTSVPTQNDTYKEKLVVAMSSGECPDMYSCWSGGPMNEYIDSGFGQPIDDLFKGSIAEEKLLPSAVAQASYKDHIYAIPYQNTSMSGIFYNKEMFDKFGLKEPETITELENICDTLVENGITPFALANSTKWTGSMYYMNLAARMGGLEPFQNAVAGEGSFTDDCFIKAGEKIQEWVNKGYFPDGVNSLSEDDGQARQLLYQEKAAMTLIGSWYAAVLPSDSEEFYAKVGWFKFPADENSEADPSIMIGTVGDQFIVFNCEGEKQAAAFECATTYLQDDMIDMAIEKGKMPPVAGVEEKVTDENLKEVMQAANDASEIQLWYDQYLPPAVATAHLDGLQEVFGLTMTPQEAQESMQKAMEEYIANKAE